MAINTLEFAKNLQQSLDKQMLVGATSGWMESNAQNVKYSGGDTVKMPEISIGGLAKYDRDNGFNQGAVTLKYADYKLTQDRGRTFMLDAMDVDESNFVASAGNVMGEFQRTQVIPEVDAFRYSKIAAHPMKRQLSRRIKQTCWKSWMMKSQKSKTLSGKENRLLLLWLLRSALS